jgi:beta-glucosidase
MMNLLTGKVNPSGKLPFSVEQRPQDSLAFGEDDKMQPGRFLTDPKDLAHRVGIRAFDFLFNKDKTEAYTRELVYREGVFVGYRWYDQKNIEPRFPFGFGLSYTTFSYQHLKLSNDELSPGGNITASVDIRNAGQRAGAEVVELYLHDLHPKTDRPVRELKGFTKVLLAPGETKSVSFTIHPRDLAYFDVRGQQWHADAGDYEVQIAASERDLRQNASFRLSADFNGSVQ